ncbi:hypothetical protein M899_0370 [Bacteriovorax sp. BSW11_IV]|uniref:DUF6178 family protein n=1 Tax=Bacteriovorax sp. BSW11_IV TaxID=1353529 RepID=UPI000389F838|nr:DUF6178 family protein [Bacteriovorax sp. BSW11_IV]EQC43042.1 hypothetical protein M899_0370 [Bacteriovorax sp. BSW11_IV]
MNKKALNVIENILAESKAYTSIELIENALTTGQDLKHFPLQPLYLVMKGLPLDKVSTSLSLLSSEQRKVFCDIDLWQKDDIDLAHFPQWVVAHALSEDDEIRFEFAKSMEFGLFLKARFNVWTFDTEDPQYPDHDNYFLTEDNLLLFEFDDECTYVNEVRKLVRDLYTDYGVEKAYAHLLKFISEDYLVLQEEEYNFKKQFLIDYGFVDYYDALEVENAFPSYSHIEHYVKSKKSFTGEVDSVAKEQTLHSTSIVAFEKGMESLQSELNKVVSDKRFQFLHFNFVKLVNATTTLDNALKNGSVAMSKVGTKTRNKILLGFSYLQDFAKPNGLLSVSGEESLFDYFEFTDIYKIGNSLQSLVLKEIKKSLHRNNLENDNENFVGPFFSDFLDNTFGEQILFSKYGRNEKPVALTTYDSFDKWHHTAKLFCAMAPFISKFNEAFKILVNEGKLSDGFYLNYTVDSIDFEAVIISSFANHLLGTYEKTSGQKMGLTIDEFKKFVNEVISKEGELMLTDKLGQTIVTFSKTYGLDTVEGFDLYLKDILKDHLEGYDYHELDQNEYRHVGGPIILNVL